MARYVGVLGLLIVSITFGCAALQWEEIEGGTTIAVDSDTGAQSIIFNVGLAYDDVPRMMRIQASWEVFVVEDGVETPLEAWTRSSERMLATERVWSSSSRIPIEEGKQYGARLTIEDLENALSFRKTFTYFAPLELSVGIRLTGDTGTQLFDMTGVPEAELAELARLQRAVASYERVSETAALTGLFSQHAASSEAFPVSVLIMPDTGMDAHGGTKDVTITLRFGLHVLVYSIENRASASAFLTQIAGFDESFSGAVYIGPGNDEFGEGATVFVHDAVHPILDAASRGGD